MPAATPAAVTTFPERTTRPYGLERLERALATERQFAGTAHTNYRRRSQLRAQEREIRMLQRTGVPTAAAELLLSPCGPDHLCREREALRKSGTSLSGRS
jgi:hypothetical protein